MKGNPKYDKIKKIISFDKCSFIDDLVSVHYNNLKVKENCK
jgi:hypothetical protein